MKEIQYSDKYFDDVYEYRHVILPAEVAKLVPKGRLLSEDEWRSLGVKQSIGWVHYAVHKPEPHILLFRRLLTESPNPPPGSIKNPTPQQQLLMQMQP